MRKNIIQVRSFTELLERTIRSYQNRTFESAEVIAVLIKLAEEMREAKKRGEKLHLSGDEITFYDALEANHTAVQVLGDETLKNIAQELVETVRKNTTIDWTVHETMRTKLRVLVKRILRKYGLSTGQTRISLANCVGAGGNHCERSGRIGQMLRCLPFL